MIAEDGSACICQRIEEGSVKRCGDAGYLHILKESELPVNRRTWTKPAPKPDIDFGPDSRKWFNATDREKLAEKLGVSSWSLGRLRVGFNGKQWTFPMSDGKGKIIGVRLRQAKSKWSVTGSKNGIFIPHDLKADSRKLLLICEGPTDCAALLDMEFEAIGRASCNTGLEYIKNFIEHYERKVVIVADRDEEKTRPDGGVFYPGQEGGERLAAEIKPFCQFVKVILPPTGKDVRSWKAEGATNTSVMRIIDNVRFK